MNESQTIPASELGLPGDAAASNLAPDEIFRILTPNFRRGSRICFAFFIISIAAFAVSLFYRHTWAAVAASILFAASKVGGMLLHEKLVLAHRISHEPQLVYWAHPCRSRVLDFTCMLTLHLRTGQTLELSTSREEALRIATWLRHHNPGMRLGAYDDISQMPSDRNSVE